MGTLDIVIILAMVGYSVYRQTKQYEIVGNGRFKMALIYAVIGIVTGVTLPHTVGAISLVVIGLALSAVVGIARGRMTTVWRDNVSGRVYARGTKVTIALFLGLVTAKFAMGVFAYFAHITDDGSFGEILVMIALMIAMQAEIVWQRGRALGARVSAPKHEKELVGS